MLRHNHDIVYISLTQHLFRDKIFPLHGFGQSMALNLKLHSNLQTWRPHKCSCKLQPNSHASEQDQNKCKMKPLVLHLTSLPLYPCHLVSFLWNRTHHIKIRKRGNGAPSWSIFVNGARRALRAAVNQPAHNSPHLEPAPPRGRARPTRFPPTSRAVPRSTPTSSWQLIALHNRRC